MKKIRFGDLVRKAGRPATIELWTAPEKSKELQRAIKANRVITVQHRNVGNKRDVGSIGFRKQPDAIYLIFPSPLPAVEPAPVIGINYELLEEPPSSAKHTAFEKAPAKASPTERVVRDKPEPKPEPRPGPQLKRFRLTIRAEIETEVEVEAKSAKEARVLALDAARRKPMSSLDWRRMDEAPKIKSIAEAKSRPAASGRSAPRAAG